MRRPKVYIHIIYNICMHLLEVGGESFGDPNRESDFGFGYVHVLCMRAKLRMSVKKPIRDRKCRGHLPKPNVLLWFGSMVAAIPIKWL